MGATERCVASVEAAWCRWLRAWQARWTRLRESAGAGAGGIEGGEDEDAAEPITKNEAVEKGRKGGQNYLTMLLCRLDGVDIQGDDGLRATRRALVRRIEEVSASLNTFANMAIDRRRHDAEERRRAVGRAAGGAVGGGTDGGAGDEAPQPSAANDEDAAGAARAAGASGAKGAGGDGASAGNTWDGGDGAVEEETKKKSMGELNARRRWWRWRRWWKGGKVILCVGCECWLRTRCVSVPVVLLPHNVLLPEPPPRSACTPQIHRYSRYLPASPPPYLP